ncbi:MAG: VTT domain-containing protein [Candidatus Sungiibacteriota bacterium]
MIAQLISMIELIMREYGAVGVFFAALLEEIIAPIPSSLVAMFAGFFLLPADKNIVGVLPAAIFTVAIPMSIGISIGSLVVFALAYFGGKPIILKWGKWFGIEWASIEKFEAKLAKGRADELVLFGARALPIVPSVAISAWCGMIRYPVRTFLLITLLGSFVRSFIMAIIGWQVRDAYIFFADVISQIETFIFAGIIGASALFLFYSWKKRRKQSA